MKKAICFVFVALTSFAQEDADKKRFEEIEKIIQSFHDDGGLAGVRGAQVLIEELNSGAEKLGLTKDDIRTDVELHMRIAGLEVRTNGDTSSKEAIIDGLNGQDLYIAVTVSPDSRAAFVSVEFRQCVQVNRNKKETCMASTWESGIVISQPTARSIRDATKDLVDKFLNAWLSRNPRSPR
ncbi:MAG TPA: hypothetical protein VIY49_37515 [Bryobacteraceae bacterium]